ncbi:hypothetical protein IWW36_003205 [Coemansia brasiliensis]|uniref:Uncharacterized protein n=1 Tax=Coemansia brasiliensis TaxID=2650707 RepID=A0A9W8I5U8_9FUNG|nr:hypothetical protein IWW36_003205 [Coemansia brasiliensis]
MGVKIALGVMAYAAVMATVASAHGDDDMGAGTMGMLPDDAPFYKWPDEPMSWVLKVHLVLAIFAYIVLLPAGFVMEMANHKYQSLVQLGGALVGFLGIVFGWVHGHIHNAYARYGWFAVSILFVHTALNLCLTLGILKRNPKAQSIYRTMGGLQLLFAYIGMVVGVINYLNLCSQGHLGQCISHFARGSALMMGAMFILVAMRLFGAVVVELRRPIEFYTSIIMITVGLIGTFTEHNFFQSSNTDDESWSHKDLQHTFIGVSWFAGGLLGLLMTWRSHPRNRTPIPAIIFIATGISMIIHQQDLAMSSHTHFMFGASLVSLGFSLICEITLLASGFVKDRDQPAPFQYLPVFFMCASGLFLMGSNRDMVLFLINSHVDVGTYSLMLLSLCFVAMFYFNALVDFYFVLADPPEAKYRALSDAYDETTSDRHSTSSQTSTLNHSASQDLSSANLA